MWTGPEIDLALNCKVGLFKDIIFSGVSINSKKINKGDLFIPIKGTKFDGHNFVAEALKNGAYAAFAERSYSKKLDKVKNQLIFVDNTYKSLVKLAIFSRKRAKNSIIISITGSSGKTTLKEWLKEILSNYYNTYANPGNLNNQIGVPLSLANMPRNSDVSILEVGMNQPGEIATLTKIIEPNIAIITNIGCAHLGNFKTKKGIASEKSKIFKFLTKNDTAIIPQDDKYFNLLKKRASKKSKNIFSFGKNKDSEFKIIKRQKQQYPDFLINRNKVTVEFKYPDEKWEYNVAVVLGVAELLKLKLSKVAKKVISLRPLKGRGMLDELTFNKTKFTLIDESYNSNPESLKDSLNFLSQKQFSKRRKIIVIGDMLELGVKSKSFHQNIIPNLEKLRPFSVITVGIFTKVIHDKLNKKISSFHFNSYENVYNKLIELLKNRDLIMIKGSNSIQLNKVCAELKKEKN